MERKAILYLITEIRDREKEHAEGGIYASK